MNGEICSWSKVGTVDYSTESSDSCLSDLGQHEHKQFSERVLDISSLRASPNN